MKLSVQLLCLCILYAVRALGQTPPVQALIGPGGSDYTHDTVSVFNYGQGDEGFWLFEPAQPIPDSSDLVVFNHGLGQINPMIHGGWIKHLVKKGNTVIYPKYQDDLSTSGELFVPSAARAILNAIDTLQNGAGHVRPRLGHFAMIGHSYGGIISANLTVLQQEYGLPEVKGLVVAQGFVDAQMRLATYEPMPDETKLLIIVGSEDAVVGDEFGRLLMDSMNVNCGYKNLITHYPDNHGSPTLGAAHEESVSLAEEFDSGETNFYVIGAQFLAKTDAVDFYCYWKLSDALIDCSFYGENCDYAFGGTANQMFMGTWGDGTDAAPMVVERCPQTGIASASNLATLKCSPNPSTGLFNVSAKHKVSSLAVYDLLGKEVLVKHSTSVGIIDLSEYQDGTYLLKVQTDKELIVQKLVKREN